MRLASTALCAAICLAPQLSFAQAIEAPSFAPGNPNSSGNANLNGFDNNSALASLNDGNQNPQQKFFNEAPNSSGVANLDGFNNGNNFFPGQNNPPSQQPLNPPPAQLLPQQQPQGLLPQQQPQGPLVQPQPPRTQLVPNPLRRPALVQGLGLNGYDAACGAYSAPAYSNLPIVIHVPRGSGVCHYDLIGAVGETYSYRMSGGEKQVIPNSTFWTIRYEAGPGLGYQVYRLDSGLEYTLKLNPHGVWQLYLGA